MNLTARIQAAYDSITIHGGTTLAQIDALATEIRKLSKNEVKAVAQCFGIMVMAGWSRVRIATEVQRKLTEARVSATRISAI